MSFVTMTALSSPSEWVTVAFAPPGKSSDVLLASDACSTWSAIGTLPWLVSDHGCCQATAPPPASTTAGARGGDQPPGGTPRARPAHRHLGGQWTDRADAGEHRGAELGGRLDGRR